MIRNLEATVTDVEDLKQLFRMVGNKIYGHSIIEDKQIIYNLSEDMYEDSIGFHTPKSVDDIADEAFRWANAHRDEICYGIPIPDYAEITDDDFEEVVMLYYDSETQDVIIQGSWEYKGD